MKTAIALLLFAFVTASTGADKFATFSTLKEQTYTNAEITELKPKGVVLYSDTGIVTIPYADLPKALQIRYGYDDATLAEALAGGVEGVYTYREGLMAFSGESIELKGEEFTLYSFTDVGPQPKPLRGKFRIEGNWIFLDHKDLASRFAARMLAVIGGRLAIFLPFQYKLWRDSGEAEPSEEPLYRKTPPK